MTLRSLWRFLLVKLWTFGPLIFCGHYMSWLDMPWNHMSICHMSCHEMSWRDMSWHDMSWHYLLCLHMLWHHMSWHHICNYVICYDHMSWRHLSWGHLSQRHNNPSCWSESSIYKPGCLDKGIIKNFCLQTCLKIDYRRLYLTL